MLICLNLSEINFNSEKYSLKMNGTEANSIVRNRNCVFVMRLAGCYGSVFQTITPLIRIKKNPRCIGLTCEYVDMYFCML